MKVLALTFIQTTLLPGALSPRAGILRHIVRGLAKTLEAFA